MFRCLVSSVAGCRGKYRHVSLGDTTVILKRISPHAWARFGGCRKGAVQPRGNYASRLLFVPLPWMTLPQGFSIPTHQMRRLRWPIH